MLWFGFGKFSEDMEFEIPTLFRREGRIEKPRSLHNVFEPEPIDDEFDQYALIDLIEFVAQNIHDITRKVIIGFLNMMIYPWGNQ